MAKPKNIRVSVGGNITLDNLHKVVAQVVHLTGCTACGLVGVDLHVLGGDPEAAKSFEGIAGVTGASFGA